MSRPVTHLYGLMAEFSTPEEVVAAAKRAYEEGYRKLDAYSPYPVEDLAESIGFTRNWVPAIVLAGGLTGAATALGMMYFSAVIHYPLNIGGRPLASWPSFVPITFELTVLFASLSAVLGMLALNGLPKPYHPVFNVPGFAQASSDRFFLCIEAEDPRFDRQGTKLFLEGLGPTTVDEVPR